MLNLSDIKFQLSNSEDQFSFRSFVNQYIDNSPYEVKSKDRFLTLKSKIDLNDLTIYADSITDIIADALYENNLAIVGDSSIYQILKYSIGLKRINEDGKFFTRLKKFFNSKDAKIVRHKTLQSKMTQEINESDFIKWKIPEKYIQLINAKIALNGKDSIKDIFDISNENYEAGKHNECGGSCWWGDYNRGRLCFIDNGGFAMRHYDENFSVMGRSWGFLHDHNGIECLILFNLYDDKYRNLNVWGDAVKSLLNDYSNKEFISKSISLYGDSILWINYSDAIVITKKEYENRLDDFHSIHMRHLKIFDNLYDYEDSYTCENCGCRISEDEVYYSDYDGCAYCEDCYYDTHSRCEECYEIYHNDQMTEVEGGGLVCDFCLSNYYVQCEQCGEYIYIDNSIYIESEDAYYCDYCHDKFFKKCENCGESYHVNDLIKVEISTGIFSYYCENCIDNDENIDKCNKCGEFKDTILLTKIDKLNYCARCEVIYKLVE
jgi:hypothetical protein